MSPSLTRTLTCTTNIISTGITPHGLRQSLTYTNTLMRGCGTVTRTIPTFITSTRISDACRTSEVSDLSVGTTSDRPGLVDRIVHDRSKGDAHRLQISSTVDGHFF